jgi:hypothetical protein
MANAIPAAADMAMCSSPPTMTWLARIGWFISHREEHRQPAEQAANRRGEQQPGPGTGKSRSSC